SKTFSVNIASSVNGATDYNLGNNSETTVFAVIGAYTANTTVESFSVSTFPPTNWIVVNSDENAATWSRVTSSGSQSTTQSARYPAYAAPGGDSDDLILPPTSLTGFTAVKLNFDVASAPYSSVTPENDQLQVKVSTDCGATWTTVFDKMGAALNTAPFTTGSFVPNATQWRSESVDLTAYANKPNVLVKFTGTSGYGNNVYVDQVNLTAGFTGVKNIDENFKSVDLFPNPATTETAVNVNLSNASEVTLTVVNNVGQIIFQSVSALQAGSNTLNIDTKAYASGIYNVVVATENGSVVKKLSVVK
ncbi:MAG: T9SS type A sorting domain-containing protein, partial [Bacteroidia bacterium]|nr:T9SS type A sorting domain-containing protein [Bacteroidia bacterium]